MNEYRTKAEKLEWESSVAEWEEAVNKFYHISTLDEQVKYNGNMNSYCAKMVIQMATHPSTRGRYRNLRESFSEEGDLEQLCKAISLDVLPKGVKIPLLDVGKEVYLTAEEEEELLIPFDHRGNVCECCGQAIKQPKKYTKDIWGFYKEDE